MNREILVRDTMGRKDNESRQLAYLHTLEFLLFIHVQVRIRRKGSVRITLVFVTTKPHNVLSVGVHVKVARHVTLNIDKVCHHKGWIARFFQKLGKFRLIFIVLDNENPLGSHAVSGLDHTRSDSTSIRQQCRGFLCHEHNRILTRQVKMDVCACFFFDI